MNTFRNGDKVYTVADIERLECELAKANERVKILERERDHSQRMYNSLLGDLSVGYGALSIPECESHLRKFAIEQKIKAIDEAIAQSKSKLNYSLPLMQITDLYDYQEQLRKEKDK